MRRMTRERARREYERRNTDDLVGQNQTFDQWLLLYGVVLLSDDSIQKRML